jgi:hypothetical protein
MSDRTKPGKPNPKDKPAPTKARQGTKPAPDDDLGVPDLPEGLPPGLADIVRAAASGKVPKGTSKRPGDPERAKRHVIAEMRRLQRLADTTADPTAAATMRTEAAKLFAEAIVLTHAPQTGRPARPRRGGKGKPPLKPGPGTIARPQSLAFVVGPRLDLPLNQQLRGELGNRVQSALAKAGLWRYEYLLQRAMEAAQGASAYEAQLLEVIAMAVNKGLGAADVLTPALLDAVNQLIDATGDLANLATDPQIDELLGEVAGLAAQFLLLQLMLLWFMENSAVEFWGGLFGAIGSDIAAFRTDLDDTKAYLADSFDILGLGSVVADLRADLENQANAMVAPLLLAVQQLIGQTNEAMASVFANFDLPLTAAPSPIAGLPDAVNVNPLDDVQEDLARVAEEVRDKIIDKLNEALAATGIQQLFSDVMTAFVVVPVLAVLVIGLASGPLGAAALAAVVAIGGQELIHLVLNWLGGPLQGALEDLRRRVFAALESLGNLIARTTAAVDALNPAASLQIVAAELRQLRNLLPTAFLDDVAALLEAARDAVLDSAVDLALAAEQALGLENATAFDVIQPTYASTALTPAPLLPGGGSPRLLASAQLLRDLSRLAHARTEVRDGREFELLHRVSLRRLLGDAAFATFLANGDVVVPLDADAMLSPTFPGLYRALIKEIRPSLSAPGGLTPLPSALAVPLTVTHLGESRTRVRRHANSASPPLEVPYGLRPSVVAAFPEAVAVAVHNAMYAAVRREIRDAQRERTIVLSFFEAWGFILANFMSIRSTRPLPVRPGSSLFPFPFPDIEIVYVNSAGGVTPVPLTAAVWESVRTSLRQVCDERTLGEISADAILPEIAAAIAPVVAQGVAADAPPFNVLAVPTDHARWDAPNDRATNLEALLASHAPELAAYCRSLRQAIDTGLSAVGVALREAGARARRRTSKWAGARFLPDPNPAAAALGFATMARQSGEETLCLTLVPGGNNGLVSLGQPASPPEGSLPSASQLRYNPFENRGFDGAVRVTLPAVVNAVRAGGVAPSAPTLGWVSGLGPAPAAAAVVEDVVLDVVVRACHDEDLATTRRAMPSREPRRSVALDSLQRNAHRVLISMRALLDNDTYAVDGPLTPPAGVTFPGTLTVRLSGTPGVPVFEGGALTIPFTALGPLAVIAAVGTTLLVGLVVGLGSAEGLIRATSALFVAVYVLALLSAVKILDGRVRAAALTALASALALAVFSAWFLLVPAAAALVALALRRFRQRSEVRSDDAGERPGSRRDRSFMHAPVADHEAPVACGPYAKRR